MAIFPKMTSDFLVGSVGGLFVGIAVAIVVYVARKDVLCRREFLGSFRDRSSRNLGQCGLALAVFLS